MVQMHKINDTKLNKPNMPARRDIPMLFFHRS